MTRDGFWGCDISIFGQVLLTAANFKMGATAKGRVRLPDDLSFATELTGTVAINLILDKNGSGNFSFVSMRVEQLTSIGVPISIQTTLRSNRFRGAEPGQKFHTVRVEGNIRSDIDPCRLRVTP